MKMKRFILLCLILATVVAGLFLFTPLKYRILVLFRGQRVSKNCPRCDIYFPDVVAVQERAYKNEGIKKQKTFRQLDNLYHRGDLMKIESNNNFLVEDMQYARPYVLPKVVDFLDELSLEYKNALEENGLSYFPFTITNATRSVESARELAETNNIARENSHHLLGKTIDISYKKFGGSTLNQSIFIKVLNEFRIAKKCYVKYEQTGALHLTVR